MARTAIDASAQDGTPSLGHSADLAQRVKVLEDLARSYANGDLVPGTVYALIFDVADHATQDVDSVMTVACALVDAEIVKITADATAVANTAQVKKGATALTDAMSMNAKVVGDKVRSNRLVTASAEFAIGDTLRLTQTKAGGDAAFRAILHVVLR